MAPGEQAYEFGEIGDGDMSDKRFSWMPIYQELGQKLLEWRKKQGELIAILGKAKVAGHLVGNLEDEPAKGQRVPLTEIDPFTFFSSFNRTADEEDRRAILAILKEAFSLSSDLPSDFEGIPIISSQRSWFFAFKYERQTDDIEKLWDLAEAVVSGGIDSVKPELFDRCLAVKMVGTAKLTMGMFWLNPVNFLALDSYNQGYLTKNGIDPEFTDYASYAQVLQQTKNKLGDKFVEISRAAWEWGNPSYWAGGFRWGEKSKLDEFRSGNFWQIGYKKDSKNASGKRCWALFDKIREGDLFAIKGYGGQNDLHIHYLGRVIEKLDTGVVKLEKLDLPHFKGKAPGGKGAGNWQETLVAVKRPDVIGLLFGTKGTSPTAENSKVDSSEEKVPDMNSVLLPSKNVILYGPPGTGKTYKLRTEYMELFTDRKAALTPDERATELIRDLSWWEAAALALLDSKENRGRVKDILEHPFVKARLKLASNQKPMNMLWVTLQTHTKEDCPHVKYGSRIQPLIFWKDENSVWSVDEKLVSTEIPALKEKLDAYRKPLSVGEPVRRYRFTTFHQSFSYEDFIEGIKPQMENIEDGDLAYEIRKGVFREIVEEAIDNYPKPYALFIDEINRGNVASIFGELITLIEDDKRLQADNKLEAVLPYSRKEFGVPSNLYIIGTMNTADRSVEALDTALRRRFTFREMRPNRSLITQPAGLKVDLGKLFDVINSRIAQLLDHDHCIGHAYFMEVKDLGGLQRAVQYKIIPLLREYFYGNPAKVGMVLGERFVLRTTDKVSFAAGTWGVDVLDEKEVYTFMDVLKFTEADFASIYA